VINYTSALFCTCYFSYWLMMNSLQSKAYILVCIASTVLLPSVLWRCWLGGRKGIRPVKTEWWGADVVICLERGADLHIAQLMPLLLTVSYFSKIQIGFTFLVPAHPGSPGKRAVKRMCVCVCVCAYWHYSHSRQSRVCETAEQMSVCLIIWLLLQQVCCCGPSSQEILIDCCTAGAQQQMRAVSHCQLM